MKRCQVHKTMNNIQSIIQDTRQSIKTIENIGGKDVLMGSKRFEHDLGEIECIFFCGSYRSGSTPQKIRFNLNGKSIAKKKLIGLFK